LIGVFLLNNVLGRAALRFGDKIIVLGPYLRQSVLDQGANPDKIHLLPPPEPNRVKFTGAHDTEEIKKSLGLSCSRPIGLFVGRLTGLKGMDFLESVIELTLKSTDYQFLVIGEGPYRNRFKKKFSSNDVILPGYVPHHNIPKYYALSTVYIHPSAYEGIPLVILEALQSGLPVVARDAGDIGYILNTVAHTEQEMVSQLIQRNWNETWLNRECFYKNHQIRVIQEVIADIIE
jgi:glycosyltransferase involved in cell wall biosynthesis